MSKVSKLGPLRWESSMGQVSKLALASLRLVAILATSHTLLPMSSNLFWVSHVHVETSEPGSVVGRRGVGGSAAGVGAPPSA